MRCSSILQVRGPIGQQPRRFDSGRGIGQLPANRLKRADRSCRTRGAPRRSRGPPRRRPAPARPTSAAMPMRPASSTCMVLTNPCPRSPSTLSAGTRQSSNSTSLVSLARMPSLSSFLPGVEAGGSAFDDEGGDALAARRAVGHRHDHDDVADAAVGRERLRAVQDPPVAVAHRRGPHARGIAARGGLGQRPRANALAPGERHQEAPLLRLGAEHEDVRRTEAVVRGDRERHRRIDARELLDADAVVERLRARLRRTSPAPGCPAVRAPPARA